MLGNAIVTLLWIVVFGAVCGPVIWGIGKLFLSGIYARVVPLLLVSVGVWLALAGDGVVGAGGLVASIFGTGSLIGGFRETREARTRHGSPLGT